MLVTPAPTQTDALMILGLFAVIMLCVSWMCHAEKNYRLYKVLLILGIIFAVPPVCYLFILAILG